jgi:hypothetical protein
MEDGGRRSASQSYSPTRALGALVALVILLALVALGLGLALAMLWTLFLWGWEVVR